MSLQIGTFYSFLLDMSFFFFFFFPHVFDWSRVIIVWKFSPLSGWLFIYPAFWGAFLLGTCSRFQVWDIWGKKIKPREFTTVFSWSTTSSVGLPYTYTFPLSESACIYFVSISGFKIFYLIGEIISSSSISIFKNVTKNLIVCICMYVFKRSIKVE